jgi:hypothetical protein
LASLVERNDVKAVSERQDSRQQSQMATNPNVIPASTLL